MHAVQLKSLETLLFEWCLLCPSKLHFKKKSFRD